MTQRNPLKPRRPHTIEAAITYCMGVLSAEEVARVIGYSAAHVRKISDPDQPEKLAIVDAEKIDAAMEEAGYEPANWLAYQARREAACSGQDHPSMLRHLEWARGQAQQAAAAAKHNGLSADEYATAKRVTVDTALELLALCRLLDEHEQERADRRVRMVER